MLKLSWTLLYLLIIGCLQAENRPPVGWWKFDEKNGTVLADSSGSGNTAHIVPGNGLERVPGRNGGALKFSSPATPEAGKSRAGFVLLPGIMSKYDFQTKGFTFEAWILPEDKYISQKRYEIASSFTKDKGPGFTFFIALQSLSFLSGEGGAGKTWGAVSGREKTDLSLRRWHHIAAVYGNGVYRIYQDGLMIGESEDSLLLTNGRSDIFIGTFCAGYYPFSGIIDDIKIYDYPRTAKNIMEAAYLENQ